ncbi:hypothetical protein GFV16_17305 [Bacillus megaterium]|uniref:hypothetical protein n=1 Tax=Priestia megaterium TaxID=1404 RepID=UPI0012936EF9|nr:hypothetical protein [Priestia megaterium]MQR87657.1 hypothetical protein [Priestia megaterium]
MERSNLIDEINNDSFIDFNVYETDLQFMGKQVSGLVFFLKNSNEDSVILNPYEVALDLIRCGDCVCEVTIIEWDKCKAITYYLDGKGHLNIDEEDFDRFAKKEVGKLGGKITEIFFKVLPLENKQICVLSKMNGINDVIEYIKSLSYYNALRIQGLDWEIRDFLVE